MGSDTTSSTGAS
ncbi:hypothetical protein F383_35225 [Gossypium arboreum]|uniref:Uncharacterized protein n=1 Tax=Gossypium arboreum TaxID=29729 RepID=A0A0B0NB83_GOSAR|nr:hypothetical protein F383_35225 [Gossypium arboreum]